MKAENENKVTTVESTLKSLHNNLRKVNYEKKCIEFKIAVLTKKSDQIYIDDIPINKVAQEYFKSHNINTLEEILVYTSKSMKDIPEEAINSVKKIIEISVYLFYIDFREKYPFCEFNY